MACIKFDKVSLDFPVYNANSRSLKFNLLKAATGGVVGSKDGVVLVRALDSLSFEIKDGERVALMGHNGSGKTTLLRVLNGIYKPTHGTAEIQGNTGSLIDITLGIETESTGRENIYLRAALLGFSKRIVDSSLDEIIDFSGLGDFIDMPVRTYSSGMHLRLAFAVSTIMRPEILFMDEWLSVGDESFQKKAESRMSDLLNTTSILVVATHSKQLIEDVCTRVMWLEHGKVVFDGSPTEASKRYFSS